MSTPEMLADSARTLMTLPLLRREESRWGLTLIAEGTDEQVRRDVWAWASAFGMEPTVVEPEPMFRGWSKYFPGWIVVELRLHGLEVTVAGRLAGKDGER